MISEDNLNDFIGAELKSVSVTDRVTHNKKMIAKLDERLYIDTILKDGSVCFEYELGGAEFVIIWIID